MANNRFPMWDDDKLDRLDRALSFARIIQHSERARVISIEGGFGSGKTFFRTRWAQHLRMLGETVVEFDAWKSDHSGDPLSAFSFELLRSLRGPVDTPGFGNQLGEVVTTVAKAGFRRESVRVAPVSKQSMMHCSPRSAALSINGRPTAIAGSPPW